jgi:hypothetical protein
VVTGGTATERERRVAFTSMKIPNQDGSRHHGVGIQPTTGYSERSAFDRQ